MHEDLHRTTLDSPYAILWLDDASREVVAVGEFTSADSDNTIATFKRA